MKDKEMKKLTWEETAQEMAWSGEDWSDWETMADGLEDCPWEGTGRRIGQVRAKNKSNLPENRL